MPHFPSTPLPHLVGRTPDDLAHCFGTPYERQGNSVIWRLPQGCSFDKTEIEVDVHEGWVTDARAHSVVTGQECD